MVSAIREETRLTQYLRNLTPMSLLVDFHLEMNSVQQNLL